MEKIAVVKLKKELKENKNKNVPAEPIANYLIAKCKDSESFSDRVNLECKTLNKCFNYVYNEVKKKLKGVNGWIADEDVYKLAEQYYELDNPDGEKENKTENKEEPKEVKKSVGVREKKKSSESKKIKQQEQFTIFNYVE